MAFLLQLLRRKRLLGLFLAAFLLPNLRAQKAVSCACFAVGETSKTHGKPKETVEKLAKALLKMW